MGKDINFQNSKFNALELNAIGRLTIAGKRFADYEPSIDAIRLNWSGNFAGGIGLGAMRVTAGGAVGINTDTPLRAFHIVGSSSQMMIESTNNHKVGFWSDGNAQAFKLSLWSNTEASFNTALTVFQNTRNLSIGSDVDTGNKLYVLGNSRFDGNMTMSGDISFASAKYFSSTGNMSIGTTTDNGAKLNVNGTLKANALILSNLYEFRTAQATDCFFGGNTGNSSSTGGYNTAVGRNSLSSLSTGAVNTAFGENVLILLTTGVENTCIGGSAGKKLTTASRNTFVGRQAGTGMLSGDNNVFIGYACGQFDKLSNELTGVTNNTYVGQSVKGTQGSNNEIVFGSYSEGLGSNTAVFGNSAITKTRLFGLTIVDNFSFNSLLTPFSNSVGSIGEIRVDSNYIYVCTGTNTWKRTPLTTY
jgi:hypothetical protein